MNITNDKVTDYINNYYKPLDETIGCFRERSEEMSIPIILKETESFLGVILNMTKPKRILEIGTAVGYSAIYFARLLPKATVLTMDRHPKLIPVATENFQTWDEGKRIDFRIGEATQILDELIEEKEAHPENFEPFDFVFIDAGKSHYKEFFERAEKLSHDNTLYICDNILMKAYLVDDREYDPGRRHRTSVKRMQEFIDYIYGREDLDITLMSDGDGLLMIRKHAKN